MVLVSQENVASIIMACFEIYSLSRVGISDLKSHIPTIASATPIPHPHLKIINPAQPWGYFLGETHKFIN